MNKYPYRLYVMDVSYFSGKMEAYLRYKEIPFERVEPSWGTINRVLYPNTGLMKVPVVETAEGLWLQDSTPMIDWFEDRHRDFPVLPDDPCQAFFCRLLEDYADEWLWRPALYYRWAFDIDARLDSARFLHDFLYDTTLRGPGQAFFVRERQRRLYVRGDGVTAATRAHVESVYRDTLVRLENILAEQPFLLGQAPCLADFGFFASMFRHFATDPTPARIMRDTAPGVYAWVARLWNSRGARLVREFQASERRTDAGAQHVWPAPGVLPRGWDAVLEDAGSAYLPYLLANAIAWREGRRTFDFTVQGVTYRSVPTVQYRVWCREQLQRRLAEIPAASKPAVEQRLQRHGCLAPLQAEGVIASHLHDGASPPVCTPTSVGRFDLLWRSITGTHWHKPGQQRPPR